MDWLTAFGVAALSFMLLMYALEARGRRFILGFPAGCALSSAYRFLAGRDRGRVVRDCAASFRGDPDLRLT